MFLMVAMTLIIASTNLLFDFKYAADDDTLGLLLLNDFILLIVLNSVHYTKSKLEAWFYLAVSVQMVLVIGYLIYRAFNRAFDTGLLFEPNRVGIGLENLWWLAPAVVYAWSLCRSIIFLLGFKGAGVCDEEDKLVPPQM